MTKRSGFAAAVVVSLIMLTASSAMAQGPGPTEYYTITWKNSIMEGVNWPVTNASCSIKVEWISNGVALQAFSSEPPLPSPQQRVQTVARVRSLINPCTALRLTANCTSSDVRVRGNYSKDVACENGTAKIKSYDGGIGWNEPNQRPPSL